MALTPHPPASAYAYPYSCQRPKDAEQDNLCVERRAADAAVQSSIWAKRTFWVGLWGTVAVVVSLVFTGLAAWAAQRSAKAAEIAIEGNDVANALSLRPYVFSPATNLKWLHEPGFPEGDIISWKIEVVWQNTGRTPATHIKARVNYKIFDSEDELKEFEFPDIGEYSEDAISLGMLQTFTAWREVPISEIIDAWNGQKMIIYWAWVEYTGLNRNYRHRTEESGALIPNTYPTRKDTIFVQNTIPYFHGTDDECFRVPQTNMVVSYARQS